jgi:hypothetical protein
MLEEAVSIIEENFIEAIALAISFASLVFAYKRTEQLEQQGELINRNSQREAVRAGFLNNNQLYQPISDGLIDLVRRHPKAWTGEDPETVRRDWEDSRIKNLLHIERIMDLYYYAYYLYRTGIIHDNEWDSYLLWISDWKDDDQTRGVEGSIFNQVRRNWYQGDYAIQMKRLYDEPSLYRPVLTECDIKILRIISGDSCPLAKIRFNQG